MVEGTIHGGLGGSVRAHGLPPFERSPAADVYDDAPAPATHARQHGPGEPVGPEEDGLELGAQFVVGEVLGGLVDAPAGVVDEDVDLDVLGLEVGDESGGGRGVVDVEGEPFVGGRGGGQFGDEVGRAGGVTRGGDEGVAGGMDGTGESEA